MRKTIVAIGGGENGRTKHDGSYSYPYETEPIDRRIVELSKKDNPNFLFIGHATASKQESYFLVMQDIYGKRFKCSCCLLHSEDLKNRQKIKELIAWADIIYVGGGNTREMLRLWQDTDFDRTMIDAYHNGKVMCGISAGANFWFKAFCSNVQRIEQNNPDASYIKVQGLGVINAVFTPHCDEPGRLDYMKALAKEENAVAISLSNCTALEMIDDKYRLITSDASLYGIKAYAYKSYWINDKYYQKEIEESIKYADLDELLSISYDE